VIASQAFLVCGRYDEVWASLRALRYVEPRIAALEHALAPLASAVRAWPGRDADGPAAPAFPAPSPAYLLGVPADRPQVIAPWTVLADAAGGSPPATGEVLHRVRLARYGAAVTLAAFPEETAALGSLRSAPYGPARPTHQGAPNVGSPETGGVVAGPAASRARETRTIIAEITARLARAGVPTAAGRAAARVPARNE
jgi:hypothetical protein